MSDERERHARSKAIFLDALERPEAERAGFVHGSCAGDAVLEARVLTLLGIAATTSLALDRVAGAVVSMSSPTRRFVDGQRVAERFRIAALLGSGGMGEVYLAHDELLGETVALKTLSPALATSREGIATLIEEAKAARAVSHPHVCRVFDAGLADGVPYLAMEYVRGRDLSACLGSDGRLGRDAALRLARQLAQALSAIHGKGLLHRDLKPANVLIDDHGNAHLTDFGLAGPVTAPDARSPGAGTPGYVAPEVLAGAPPSVASDLFAFGVMLFEAVTGRRAFLSHASVRALAAKRDDAPSLARFGVETDPVLERIIAACLAPDPAERPHSAGALAAALTIDDPLTAVIALGQHPSPRVIAASGARGFLEARQAIRAGLAVLSMLAGYAVLTAHTVSPEAAGLDRSPEHWAESARVVIEEAGVPADERGRSYRGYGGFGGAREPGMLYPRGLGDRGDDVFFWYRESRDGFANWNLLSTITNSGRVSETEPPLTDFTSQTVWIDPRYDRLVWFQTTPAPIEERTATQGEADFAPLFARAALDSSRLVRAQPVIALATACAERWSWQGTIEAREIVVEAGALEGRPCLFAVFERAKDDAASARAASREDLAFVFVYVFSPLLLFAALGLAWVNLRRGRGDPWGAFRLAIFAFVTLALEYVLATDYPSSPPIAAIFVVGGLAPPLLGATGAFVLYMAFEPWAQRFWPRTLVSWSRLLQRRIDDPLVASHVVIGVLMGIAIEMAASACVAADALATRQELPLARAALASLPGVRHALAFVCNAPFEGLFLALIWLSLLVVFRAIARRASFAITLTVVAAALPLALMVPKPLSFLALAGLVQAAVGVTVLVRYGLLPCAVAETCSYLLANVPMTLDPGAWFAASPVAAFGTIALLGLAGAWALGRARAPLR